MELSPKQIKMFKLLTRIVDPNYDPKKVSITIGFEKQPKPIIISQGNPKQSII